MRIWYFCQGFDLVERKEGQFRKLGRGGRWWRLSSISIMIICPRIVRMSLEEKDKTRVIPVRDVGSGSRVPINHHSQVVQSRETGRSCHHVLLPRFFLNTFVLTCRLVVPSCFRICIAAAEPAYSSFIFPQQVDRRPFYGAEVRTASRSRAQLLP
jgi:hypothetical protein